MKENIITVDGTKLVDHMVQKATELTQLRTDLRDAVRLLKEAKPYFYQSPVPYANSLYKKLLDFLNRPSVKAAMDGND